MSSTSRTYSVNAMYHSFVVALCSKLIYIYKYIYINYSIVFQQDNYYTNCTMIELKRAENHAIFFLQTARKRKIRVQL